MNITELTDRIQELTKQIEFERNHIAEITARFQKEGRDSTEEERREIEEIAPGAFNEAIKSNDVYAPFDVSPVTYPAYKSTEVYVRGVTKFENICLVDDRIIGEIPPAEPIEDEKNDQKDKKTESDEEFLERINGVLKSVYPQSIHINNLILTESSSAAGFFIARKDF